MKRSTLQIASGALLIIPILFSDSLTGSFLQALFLIMLALLSGRKFRLLPNLILLISVSLAHTLQPNGLQLFAIGSFPITLGSLIIGAKKALLLISFMYVSHYMMKYRPKFPGTIGKLLSLQFYYYDKLTSEWHSIETKKPLITAIDTLLLRVSEESIEVDLEEKEGVKATKQEMITHLLQVGGMYLIFILFSEGIKQFIPVMELLP
jgi:heptaprenyl diphosphate synthase